MPPRKKQAGINALIGKSITMESKYDYKPVIGILVSTDEDYLGVEVNGRLFYFHKFIIRAITETRDPIEPS